MCVPYFKDYLTATGFRPTSARTSISRDVTGVGKLFEIIGAMPVAAPLPDVASHVVEAVPIRRARAQEVGSESRLNDNSQARPHRAQPGRSRRLRGP
jgi:hypothetical protein